MKISDRFTDYGLIGGFFWMLQFALMETIGRYSLADQVHGLGMALKNLPSESYPALAALLGALALIAIFTTGMLLDLLGSTYFRGDEMRVFLRHAQRNEVWLQRLIAQHEDYVEKDWSALLDVPPVWMQMKKLLLATIKIEFMFWSGRVRREYATLIRELRPRNRAALQAYARMHSFLLSYVLLLSGSGNIELLSTQLSLWNTSRALSTAMALVALEAFVTVFIVFVPSTIVALAPAYLVLIGLSAIAWAVSRSAYGRACGTLFSLAYVTYEKRADSRHGLASKSARGQI